MYQVHGFLDDKKIINQRMAHLPRCGDTMRFAGEKYGKVTEVIWAMDEDDCIGAQRINMRIESLKNTDETPNVKLRGAPLLARPSRTPCYG